MRLHYVLFFTLLAFGFYVQRPEVNGRTPASVEKTSAMADMAASGGY